MSEKQKPKIRDQRGVVLILTFIVMVALTAVVAAFLFLTSFQTKGGGYDISSHKALWLAEAGLQQVIYQLDTDADYRDSPTTVEDDLGDGSYSVTVSKDGNTYTLTSIGTVSVLSRKITQSVDIVFDFPDAFDYAIFGDTNSSTLKIQRDVEISGDVYYDGDVEVKSPASVTGGLVYADNVSGTGTYSAAPGPPDPVPGYPTFDTSWYDTQITTAQGQAKGNWTLNGTDSYDLGGGTVYYKGTVKIKDNATITGSGTIVATDDVTIQNNANISSSVTIISKKNVLIKNSAVVQSEAILYGRKQVKLKDSANVTGSLIVPTNNKKVIMDGNATLTGIIYADKVQLTKDIVISGSVVADEYEGDKIRGDNKNSNLSITYDQSSIPNSLPPGLEVVVPQLDWNEIVPAT